MRGRVRVAAIATWRAAWPAAMSATLLGATLVAACASPGLPPGGPKDEVAPKILRITPDSGALNVRASSVRIELDEVVSERPGAVRAVSTAGRAPVRAPATAPVPSGGGTGGEGLGTLVIVSPSRGGDRVEWHRNMIEVAPRGGFRANTAYRVTLLPGLADLRGNAIAEPREIVFSTGAAIPTGEIAGQVFDWVAGIEAASAMVELFLPADSTFRWRARADTAGRYALRDLAPGRYRLRAWLDADNDREIDALESFDSTMVALDDRATVELYAFVHDTLGPRIESVTPHDSTALRVRFDRAVAPAWTPDASSVTLLRADSSRVTLGEILSAAVFDSVEAATRAAADTARAPTEGARAAAPRAAVPPRPALSRPIPRRDWVIRLSAPLPPGRYLLRVSDAVGLLGVRRSSERELRVQEPTRADPAALPRPTPPSRP